MGTFDVAAQKSADCPWLAGAVRFTPRAGCSSLETGSAGETVRIVYQAENIIDANLVKNALEHEAIHAFVSGQYLTGAAGELPPMALVNVMVGEADWPRARAIAEQVDAELAERREVPDSDWLFEPA